MVIAVIAQAYRYVFTISVSYSVSYCKASYPYSLILKMFFFNLFRKHSEPETDNSMKYLIVGLGNIGDEYVGTRHNIGFMLIDAFAKAQSAEWADKRYGAVAHCRVKNAEITLLKPSTYMNLSGQAVRYWMQQEKIDVENVLILVDDLSLPVGKIRMRGNGSAGGHNGLKNIEQLLGTANYSRIKFGIGNDFPKGGQVDFVLGKFSDEDQNVINEKLDYVCDMIKSFCLAGLTVTMNQYNKK